MSREEVHSFSITFSLITIEYHVRKAVTGVNEGIQVVVCH